MLFRYLLDSAGNLPTRCARPPEYLVAIMGIILSDNSANEIWHSDHRLARGCPPLSRRTSIPHMQTGEVKQLFPELEKYGIKTVPIEILAASPSARRSSDRVHCRVQKEPLPSKSLVRLEHGIYTASPEMCFVQMGKAKSITELIELGYEYCGSYATDDAAEDGMRRRDAISTPKQIQSYIEGAPGMRGCRLARTAANYIVPNSASPMETIQSMLFCLPNSLGGYRIPGARLNYRINIPEHMRDFAGKGSYRCDMLWPEFGLAVEYDSNSKHTGGYRLSMDSRRRNILAKMGIRVITVTWGQLISVREFDEIAHMIAKDIGHQIQIRCDDFELKRSRLRKQLLTERMKRMYSNMSKKDLR